MSTIVTRAGKGSPLTNNEVDANFVNLNTDKIESITSVDGSVVITPTGTTRDLSVGTALNTATLISQVRNETGATLTKGTVVYVSGASSNKALVSKALANADATSAQTYGVIQADISNNQNGYVVVIGVVSGLNTSAFANGTQLYLSGTTAGTYTSTKPYAPIHLVYVGIVTYSHANQGTIEVKIQNGYEMDELHNVAAQSPTNGQTLVYNTSTSLWEKNTVSLTAGVNGVLPTANGGTNLSSFTSGGVVYASSTSALATGSALTFDGTNPSTTGRWKSTNETAFIAQPSTTTLGAYGQYTNAGGTAYIGLNNSTGGTFGGAAYGLVYYHGGAYPHTWYISGTEQMRLTLTGLGIGTSSPSTKLDVSGADGVRARVIATSGGTSGLILSSSGNTAYSIKAGNADNSLRIDQDGTDRITLASGGNVGIGTNSPAHRLDVTTTSSAVGSFARTTGTAVVKIQGISGNSVLAFGDGSTIGATSVWSLGRKNSDNSFRINYNEDSLDTTNYVTLKTDGNFGIGTTSPSYPLDIGTTQSAETIARVLNSSTNAGAASIFRVQNSTNNLDVGIRSTGASAFGALDANSAYFGYNGGTSLVLFASNASAVIKFATGGSAERMRLDASGNLLVGTTTNTNTSKLVVNGTISQTVGGTQYQVVDQSDIGTGANEIPLNQYLGSMAYQNGDAYYNTGMTVGFRNRIINGAMTINQRYSTTVVTPADGDYTLDRWRLPLSQPSKLTIQQSTTAPTGFGNSALITSTSAYSVGASEGFLFAQKIEGFNFVDMSWGTSSATSVTLSFWVRSSLTGTFGGSLSNQLNNRWYAISYTINAANTWEQKTITIAGDTSGTWVGGTNGVGLNLYFSLGSGSSVNGAAGLWGSSTLYSVTNSTNVVGTNGATWYITGVQLEKGNIATSFDVRPYGTELQLCQRYFQKISGFVCASGTAGLTGCATSVMFKTEMRASPSVGLTAVLAVTQVNTNDYTQSSISVSIAGGGARVSTLGVNASFDNFPTLPTNCPLPSLVNSGVLTLSAEL